MAFCATQATPERLDGILGCSALLLLGFLRLHSLSTTKIGSKFTSWLRSFQRLIYDYNTLTLFKLFIMSRIDWNVNRYLGRQNKAWVGKSLRYIKCSVFRVFIRSAGLQKNQPRVSIRREEDWEREIENEAKSAKEIERFWEIASFSVLTTLTTHACSNLWRDLLFWTVS